MLLITDLDNTLYDWVTFFSRSFTAMASVLADLIDADEEQILDEFKRVHQHYGNSEQPFAILELPSVQEHFGDLSRSELRDEVDEALYAFNSARKRYLKLYEGVEETLEALHGSGVTIVGHTEAIAENAYFRLSKLDISKYFKHLYALEGRVKPHPNPESSFELPESLIELIPTEERKPNPELLLDICDREGVQTSDAWYVGDSITRDISMANRAGVHSVYAQYGKSFSQEDWDNLVRVTHWTDADVAREERLRERFGDVVPDHVINSYADLKPLLGV